MNIEPWTLAQKEDATCLYVFFLQRVRVMSEVHPKQCGLLLVVVMVLVFAGPRSAQALSLSPPIFEYSARPGEEIAGTLKLYNETDALGTFYPTVQDFIAADDETGTPHFLPEGTVSQTSIVSWVAFEDTAVVLKPDETRYVPFTIRVPDGTVSGSYFGGLLMGTASPQAESGLAIGTKVGALVLISIEGDATTSGVIAGFDTDPTIVTSLPANFRIRFQNTGTVHLAPLGEIHITNMLGGRSATIPVNIEGSYVLPNSTRRFDARWQKQEVTADAVELVNEWKNFGLGLYTATLVMDYDEDSPVATATTRFWVIPWQLLALATVTITILIALARSRQQTIVAKRTETTKF